VYMGINIHYGDHKNVNHYESSSTSVLCHNLLGDSTVPTDIEKENNVLTICILTQFTKSNAYSYWQ
jgi:hypothetical protein